MRNWPQTVISQFSDSPRLLALLESIDEWISPDVDLENFYRFIWDIRPVGGASGAGLDIWGRIVGISRTLTLTTGSYFGFAEAGDRTGFEQAAFWDGNPTTNNYVLTDETYRFLIFAKAALNITNCSIPAINRILLNLFPGRGNCYVMDNKPPVAISVFGFQEAGDRTGFNQSPFCDFLISIIPNNMQLTYVFDFVLQPFEIAIVKSGVLPKPVGVKAAWQYL